MPLILIIVLLVLIFGGGGGFVYGPLGAGGGLTLVFILVLVWLLIRGPRE
jgi:hypothetical protein